MDIKTILNHCDHTLLKQEATWDQIKEIADDGMKYETASICIPPCYIKRVHDYTNGKLNICTVIGFPNGNMTTETKVFETKDAIEKGANEIDMVINIGELKAACGDHILNVIIETCLLTDEEKIKMCELVTEAKADYIKTSTGFSTAGATFDDIALFAKHVGPDVKMKAAGGIGSIADAEKFMELGADRLGTSRVVKIVKDENLL